MIDNIVNEDYKIKRESPKIQLFSVSTNHHFIKILQKMLLQYLTIAKAKKVRFDAIF